MEEKGGNQEDNREEAEKETRDGSAKEKMRQAREVIGGQQREVLFLGLGLVCGVRNIAVAAIGVGGGAAQ